MFRRVALCATLAVACAQIVTPSGEPVPPISAAVTNWTMEGGGPYREGVIQYDGSADALGAARFWYYDLSAGSVYCEKPQPDTASATPLMYANVWIVVDCSNNIHAFASPDGTTTPGGRLTSLWSWDPTTAGLNLDRTPTMATPVISAWRGMMWCLYKDATRPALFALRLNNGGRSLPSLVWQVDLSQTFGVNDNGAQVVFRTWSEDHAIMYYGGKIWVPSQDFDGALIVDALAGPNAAIRWTTGLSNDNHRLRGSVGSQALGWRSPLFVASGSMYGLQAFDPATGNRSFWSNNIFNAYSQEFSHPVAVTFASRDYGIVNCIIAAQWDQTGDIFLSGVNSNSTGPCGFWSPNGYTIRRPEIAQPLWVSAPAVIYDGFQTVYLAFAVVLPSGDYSPGDRIHRRSSLVTIQVDQTGPYSQPVDSWIVTGARFNAAPVVIRDAWGVGQHAIAVGASDGQLHIFTAKGFSNTGPVFSHALLKLLPKPNNPAYPGATNDNAGISGNYMAASRGGSVGMIVHNADAEMNWFVIVSGAQFPLATDTTPSPSQRPVGASASPAPAPAGNAAAAAAKVDAVGATFGVLGGVAAACLAIVYFAPTSTAAFYISSGASSVYSAGAGAMSSLSGGARAGAPAAASSSAAAGVYATGGYNSERSGLLGK